MTGFQHAWDQTRAEARLTPPPAFTDAEQAAIRAVEARPVDPAAWHSLAFAFLEAGKLEAARDSLIRSVTLDPTAVMALNNLGIIHQKLGETEPALAAYQAALARDPDNATAHNNLANLLSELGRFDASLEHARSAVRLDPGQLAAYVYAAVAETHLDHREAALAWLDGALAVAPHSARVLIERADLLRNLGRAAEGLAACQTALALGPGNAKAFNILGLLHQALGEDEAALAAFDRAAALAPDAPNVPTNKAIVLLELGRQAEAVTCLDQALSLDPGLASAWFVRADLKRFAADDPDIAVMERGLSLGPKTTRDQILLSYALGKAYLDHQDGARAFAHLNHGARLKRRQLVYDPAAAGREMAQIAEAFSRDLFARFDRSSSPSPAPIFIIGMPRSGGTLVEQILASHPHVHGGGETRHLEQLIRALDHDPRVTFDLDAAAAAAMGREYLALAHAGADAPRVTDKAADNFLNAGLIHMILPNARIIHVRRDPIDTCLSCYSKLFASGQEFSYDLAELGGYYRLYDQLSAHWRAVLPPDRYIEVAYEAVVDDLESQARRLTAFCDLPWDPACLSFHQTARTVRTASLSQVRQPLYRTSLGRWRAYRDQLAPLIEALGRSAGDPETI